MAILASAKDAIVQMTELNARRLADDLKAIPADKRNVSPGGCARTPLSIVAECGSLNGRVATFLKGGEMVRFPPAELEAIFRPYNTLEKALAYLDEQTAILIETIRGLDDAALGEISDKPFGRPVSLYVTALMPASHMSYHDGQLNYIQMLGDDQTVHWA
jgi:hypothetical protein